MVRSRRYHSVTFKRLVVLGRFSERSPFASLARQYELAPNLIRTWEKANHAGHLDDMTRQDAKALEARIRELERTVGKLTMENELLKKVEELS